MTTPPTDKIIKKRGWTVLIAPDVATGETIVRNDPDLAGALVVTPRSTNRVRGCNVSRMCVADAKWPDAAALQRTIDAVRVGMATQKENPA